MLRSGAKLVALAFIVLTIIAGVLYFWMNQAPTISAS